MNFLVEFLQCDQVGGDVFANGGVRAASSFHGADSFRLERLVFREKFPVFFGKNIIGHGRDTYGFTQPLAELQHQRGLTAADRTADSNGECAPSEIAINGEFAVMKATRAIRVSMAISVMRMKVKE